MSLDIPVPIFRILSEHHWSHAAKIMLQKDSLSQIAGIADAWRYILVRNSTNPSLIFQETWHFDRLINKEIMNI